MGVYKQVSTKYDVKPEVLTPYFPDYLCVPIWRWFSQIAQHQRLIDYARLSDAFHSMLLLEFKEFFPQTVEEFGKFLFQDIYRILHFLKFILANHGAKKYSHHSESYGKQLEAILLEGGSGYSVLENDKDNYTLIERVPQLVKLQSEDAITCDDELNRAWESCYGLNPKYEDVVKHCQNALEKLLMDSYLKRDPKPQLGKMIADVKHGNKLQFAGADLLGDNKNILLDLIKMLPEYRGMHKAGTGKTPSKEQAEYMLYTSIYFWNLHRNEGTF